MLPTKTLAATTIPKLNIFLVDGWIDGFKQQQVWQQQKTFSPLVGNLQTLLLRQLGSRTAEAYNYTPLLAYPQSPGRQWIVWHGFMGKTEVKSLNLHLPPVVFALHRSFYLLK